MSNSTSCLNCETKIVGKFCFNCGQKTDTHRITFKHFIFHDILHGVWHVEKGIFFTLKEALIRPGKAALDYISGKRIRYYNVFYLTLLLMGINLYLNHIFEILDKKYSNSYVSENLELDNFLVDNAKLFILSLVPILSIISYFIFKKIKLNLSEHFILSGIFVLGILFITTIGSLFYLFDYTQNLQIVSDLFNVLTPIIILIYLFYGYFSAFKSFYSKKSLLFRVLSLLILFFLGIISFGLIIKILLRQ